MKFIFRSLAIVFASVLTLVSFVYTVKAFTLNPATGGVLANGATQVITIKANPTGASNGVDVYLNVTGMTVISYTDAPGTLVLGNCAGSAKYESGRVCVSIAKGSGNFTVGESIGSFTVQGTGQTGTITVGANSIYSDDQVVTEGTELLRFSSSLPNTSLDWKGLPLLFAGMALVTSGILIRKLKLNSNLA